MRQTEVDLAHDLRVSLREFEKGAVPQRDLAALGGLFGSETEVRHQLDEPPHRVGTLRTVHPLRAQPRAPGPTGRRGRSGTAWMGGQIGEQHFGQEPIVARSAPIHAGHDLEQLGGPARSDRRRGDTFDLTPVDQRTQVETDRIGMDREPLGDLGDSQRPLRRPQLSEDVCGGVLTPRIRAVHDPRVYTTASCENSRRHEISPRCDATGVRQRLV